MLGFEVDVRSPHRLEVGKHADVEVILKRRRWFGEAFGVEVEWLLEGERYGAAYVPWVDSAVVFKLPVLVQQRMRDGVQQVRLSSVTPFGLVQTVRLLSSDEAVMVVPRAMKAGTILLVGGHANVSDDGGGMRGYGAGELKGLADWSVGDSLKRVAWPASVRSMARGFGLVVKETEQPAMSPRRCLVVLHSHGGERWLIQPQRFEKALSLVLGVLVQLRRQGMSVSFMADFDEWELRSVDNDAQFRGVCVHLSGAERSRGTERHDFVNALERVEQESALVVISDVPCGLWADVLSGWEGPLSLMDAGDEKRRVSL